MISHLKGLLRHLVSLEMCCCNKFCVSKQFWVMHSLLYFTILYPKHKHLVRNEFPQDTKSLLPLPIQDKYFLRIKSYFQPKLKVLSKL